MESHIRSHLHGDNSSKIVTSSSNGTTALHLVLMSIGVGPGDEVIVPDFGYIAPVNTVLMCGATPVVVDVDKFTWCLDPELVSMAITKRTKAIIAIDNYGLFANIERIRTLIPDNIVIIEDAAESFPSIYSSPHDLYKGDFITTSFYANKVVTSGEGGAISGEPEFIAKINSLKSQSVNSLGTFDHVDIGYNYRISNLHAAVFCAQWEKLTQILDNRTRVFNHYFNMLLTEGVNFESNQFLSLKNPWLLALRLPDLDVSINQIRNELSKLGIETRPGFKPASQHKYLEGKIRISSPIENANSLYNEIICLPTYPDLANSDIEYICKSLNNLLLK